MSPLACQAARSSISTRVPHDGWLPRRGTGRRPNVGADQGWLVLVVVRDVARRRLLDLQQELGVALGLAQLADDQLERLRVLERGQHPAQLPDDLKLRAV